LNLHGSVVDLSHVVVLDGAYRTRGLTVDDSRGSQIRPEFICVEGSTDEGATLPEQFLQVLN